MTDITEQEIIEILNEVENKANSTIYDNYYIELKPQIAKAIMDKVKEKEFKEALIRQAKEDEKE